VMLVIIKIFPLSKAYELQYYQKSMTFIMCEVDLTMT